MASKHIETLIGNFNQKLQAQAAEMKALLLAGNLSEFENQLAQQTDDLYNELVQTLIEEVTQKPEMVEKARQLAQKKDRDRFVKPV